MPSTGIWTLFSRSEKSLKVVEERSKIITQGKRTPGLKYTKLAQVHGNEHLN